MTAIANVLAQVFPASSTQTDVLKQLALFLRSRLALAIAGLAKRLQLRSNRRALADLSDRQLRDAGIDLSLAGRGKAAAASAATLRRLQSLVHG